MKITVAALTIPNWKGDQVCTLQVRSNDDFTTSDGLQIYAYSQNQPNVYKEVACVYDGTAKSLTIPAFQIDTTDDSLDNPGATYTAYIIGRRTKQPHLESFPVYKSLAPSTTWATIEITDLSPIVFNLQRNRYYTDQQIDAKDAIILAQVLAQIPTSAPIVTGGGFSWTEI